MQVGYIWARLEKSMGTLMPSKLSNLIIFHIIISNFIFDLPTSKLPTFWICHQHFLSTNEVGKSQLHKTTQPAYKLFNLEFKPNFECASHYWSIWISRLFDLANDRFWWVFVFSVLMETVWYNEKKSILRIFLVSTLFSAVQTVSSVNEIEKP